MSHVFRNHTVICNWNSRGKPIVESLQSFSKRPIVVVARDVAPVIRDVGGRSDLFVIAGDCAKREVLLNADAQNAHCVLVLAEEALGNLADARSVQIALAVERIQVSVHTVVEIHNIQNKTHFSWTKVDELVAQEEISVRMMAQAIRHVLSDRREGHAEGFRESLLMGVYKEIVDPEACGNQVFRVDLPWSNVKQLTFRDLLARGLELSLLPVGLVGFREHEIEERPNVEAWRSWKADLKTNPDPRMKLGELWPEWPEHGEELGVVLFARSRSDAYAFAKSFG